MFERPVCVCIDRRNVVGVDPSMVSMQLREIASWRLAQRTLLSDGCKLCRSDRAVGCRLAARGRAGQRERCAGAAGRPRRPVASVSGPLIRCCVSTWTWCTIPDVEVALLELRRVLKPGCPLHFVGHGLAPDESVRRWQHRLDPIEKRLFGGCHFSRPIVELVTNAGFSITELDVFYEKGGPRFAGATSLGAAISP